MRLDLLKIFRWGLTPNHPIRFIGYWRLIDDRVEDPCSYSLRFTPNPRKDVMDVNFAFITIEIHHSCLPEEVFRPLPLQKHINTTVRGTGSRPECLKSGWLESSGYYRYWFARTWIINPSQ